jgi:ribosomal protein S18 acetylase RimI-like enzyme
MWLLKKLEWDSDFFGYPVAQVCSTSDEIEVYKEILAEIKIQNIKLAYWMVHPDNHSFQEFARNNQGVLVDIKTTYSCELATSDLTTIDNIEIVDKNEPDTDLLKLAIQCGAFSRFAIDKKIPIAKFEDLYKLWIINSLNKSMADDVIIYKSGNRTVGLVTVYKKNRIGNIGLIGVDEEFRGKGIGKTLMNAVKSYFIAKGILKIHVVTQGQNLSACRLYETTGFSVIEKSEFYHFWIK